MSDVLEERVVSVVIVGARGRMGRSLIREVLDSDVLTLAGAVARPGSPGVGQDVGALCEMNDVGVLLQDELTPHRRNVVVDFSLPEATDRVIDTCLEYRTPLVLGTTGLTSATRERLTSAAKTIPIVAAANFSVGVTLMIRMAEIAARSLGQEWDAEIVELHHRHKRDSPSGTALRMAEAVAAATERTLETAKVTNRDEVGPREAGEIGIMGLRGGNAVGEHTLMFVGHSERIELTHRALDRAIFARGALRAAHWAYEQSPGLYDMPDVLGLGT